MNSSSVNKLIITKDILIDFCKLNFPTPKSKASSLIRKKNKALRLKNFSEALNNLFELIPLLERLKEKYSDNVVILFNLRDAYAEIALCYEMQEHLDLAGILYLKALQVNCPEWAREDEAYLGAWFCYRSRLNNYEAILQAAEVALKKIEILKPYPNKSLYMGVMWESKVYALCHLPNINEKEIVFSCAKILNLHASQLIKLQAAFKMAKYENVNLNNALQAYLIAHNLAQLRNDKKRILIAIFEKIHLPKNSTLLATCDRETFSYLYANVGATFNLTMSMSNSTEYNYRVFYNYLLAALAVHKTPHLRKLNPLRQAITQVTPLIDTYYSQDSPINTLLAKANLKITDYLAAQNRFERLFMYSFKASYPLLPSSMSVLSLFSANYRCIELQAKSVLPNQRYTELSNTEMTAKYERDCQVVAMCKKKYDISQRKTKNYFRKNLHYLSLFSSDKKSMLDSGADIEILFNGPKL